jgi:uncharacterized membrane protein (UPF0127 family)
MGLRLSLKKEVKSFTIKVMKSFFLALSISFSIVVSAASDLHFEKKKLKIGSQTLTVEIADTQEKLAQGLMYRKDLAEGSGMLFIFSDEDVRRFWMKNTFVPLSIGYFNAKKELIDIQDMAPAQSEMQVDFPTYPSKRPAQYALEVPKGWFDKHKVRLKQSFSIQ